MQQVVHRKIKKKEQVAVSPRACVPKKRGPGNAKGEKEGPKEAGSSPGKTLNRKIFSETLFLVFLRKRGPKTHWTDCVLINKY